MDSKIIGNNLLKLRKKYKRTTAEVAKSCNISRSAVSMYENGKRIPKDNIKVKMANYYNVSIEKIFTQFSHKTRQKERKKMSELQIFNNEKYGVNSIEVIDNLGRTQQATFINESNLYKLAFTSRKKEAEEFTEWVTSEVLPSIRKHGGYLTSDKIEEVLTNPDTIIKLATELKKLRTENQMQAQQIAELKPIKEYVDIILQSTDTVTITQIAADYGLSAKKLNKILNEEKVQHKVNDQWILYSNMMNKGYTKSETIDIERSDGRIESKMYTRWTQKGRLKIHEILTSLGFIANYDREQQKLFA